jgi:hypothetical protein
VPRDGLSGEVLPAKSLLWATIKDLEPLLSELRQALPVPLEAVASDGECSVNLRLTGAGSPKRKRGMHLPSQQPVK